jgi:hypothetical protein
MQVSKVSKQQQQQRSQKQQQYHFYYGPNMIITKLLCVLKNNILAVEGTSNAGNVNNVAAEECAATGTSSSSSCSSSSATKTTTIAATRATTTTTTIDSSSALPEPSVQQQQQHQESTSTSTSTSIFTSTSTSKIISVEGVDLPGMRILDGISLYRNGHGMRFIPFFGLSIKIYVASVYSSIPILTVEQIMGKEKVDGNGDGNGYNNNVDNHHHHDGPIQLDFTFLRYVGKSRVVSAWKQQLDHSVTYKDYDEYETDKAKFIQLLSSQPIENLGTQSVQLINSETRIIDQGKLMGIIRGKKFQRSFLSMWFGPMAVSDELKLNFLRGDAHPTTSTASILQQQQQQQQLEKLQQSTQIPVEA